MSTFTSNILNKVGEKSIQTLSIGLAIAIGTLPLAGTFILINSGRVTIKTEDRSLDFVGKGRAVALKSEEKVEKLQQQFDELHSSYRELTRVVETRSSDRLLKSKVKKVEQEFVESEIRLDDVKESQKEVEEFVESATENDSLHR